MVETGNNNPGNTFQSLMNQKWSCKVIIGYGAGIYAGEGVEAFFIAKCSDKDINIVELMAIYSDLCKDHNYLLKLRGKFKQKKIPLKARLRAWWQKRFPPKFEYHYPADILQDPKDDSIHTSK